MSNDDAGPSNSGAGDPLFGAVPPPTQASPSTTVTPAGPASGIGPSNPLYWASPPPTSSTPVKQMPTSTPNVHGPPSLPARPSRSPTLRGPSSIPAFLRRITFIFSLILGASSAVAFVFSTLVLPRLHASYAARKALLDQQTVRIDSLLSTLRSIRTQKLYGLPESAIQLGGDSETQSSQEKGEDGGQASFEEIPSASSSTVGEPVDTSRKRGEASAIEPDLAPVRLALSTLASTRSNTSTTRSSLLATLESYTSSLHRALWSPRPGHGGYSVGLNSLNANLAKERHGAGIGDSGAYGGSAKGGFTELGVSDRGEEYDAVRREIRTIKGMLLNRRNFTPLGAAAS